MMIEKYVKEAKKENWDLIDSDMPKIVKDPDNVRWAYQKALDDTDENVRDLGASILEKGKIPRGQLEKVKQHLFEKMMTDSNPYVRYRCAFALINHSTGEYNSELKKVIAEAKLDPDVADQAQEYEKKLH